MSSAVWDPAEFGRLQRQVVDRLTAVRSAVRRHFLAEAAARTGSALLALAALSLLLDWWLELSLPARCTFLVGSAVLVAWVVYRFLVVPWRMALTPIELAAVLDEVHGHGPREALAPRVASVLQLPAHHDDPEETSPALIQRAVAQSYDWLQSVDFSKSVSARHLWLSLAALLAALAVPSLFSAALPGTARLWAERWLMASDRPWPHDTRIEIIDVEDGRIVVPRGEAATLQVRVFDKNEPTETVWMRMTSDQGRSETVTLTRFSDGDFRYELPPLQRPLDARVWGGDAKTEQVRIVPVDRPRIAELTLVARHPRASSPEQFHFTAQEGNLRLLPRSEVKLQLVANVPIAKLELETAAAAPREFRQTGETTFVTEWTHTQPVQMQITLVSREAGLVSLPRPLSIDVKPDRPPRLGLRYHGVRQRVTPSATIPVTANAADDYAVRSVALNVEIPERPGVDAAEGSDDEDAAAADDATTNEPAANDSGAEPAGDQGVNGSTDVAGADKGPLKDRPPADADDVANHQPPPADDGPFAGDDARVKVAQSRPGPVVMYGPADPATERTLEREHAVELEPLAMAPGQLVALQGTVIDDCYTGAQQAQSRKLVFRVVKPEDLFREILLRQQQLRARLRKAADQAEGLRAELRTAALPDDAATLLRRHQLIRRETGQVSRALEATVTEMRLNKLGGAESYELIEQTVLEPLAQLHDQLMQRQTQAFESLLSERPEPLAQLEERQQEIVDVMQKILHNMSQWDSFIDVVNQLNTVIKLEQRIRVHTEELRRKQVESIFDD